MPANSQVPLFFRLDLYRGSEKPLKYFELGDRNHEALFHILDGESNRSVQGPLGILTIDLLLHFLALDVLHALMWGEKKCDFAMQAITSGWHLGLENLGGWSWMRKILFETLSELPRAPLLLHICHVGICHILNLAFNYAKFRNTSRRRRTFLKNFVTVNKENLLPSRFNLIEVNFWKADICKDMTPKSSLDLVRKV